MTAHDLLTEPLLTLRTVHATRRLTLPGMLSALGQGAVGVSFPNLQPVQSHAWHAFLVQLAVMAVARHGVALGASEPAWRQALLALAGGQASAWCLFEPDLRKPAFMQPPIPGGSLDTYKAPEGVGALDLPVTTRNHEVKGARLTAPKPEHWALALATFQTMQGFSGRDNYGIVRMNGGSGNRPGVGLTPSLDPGPRFRRDVAVVLSARAVTCETVGFDPQGLTLLWLEAWDGRTSLPLTELDPHALEVCRRLRVVGEPLSLRMATSKCARVALGNSHGVLGDPWTPFLRSDSPKSMTLSSQGFDYQRVRELLLGDTWQGGPAQQPADDERGQPLLLSLWALVRGNGKTEGMHTRTVALSETVTSWFGTPKEVELAERASRWAGHAGVVRNKLLGFGLSKLCGGYDHLPPSPQRAFDAAVDEAYFPRLFDSLERDADPAEATWVRWLIAQAAAQLEATINATPLPTARRYRLITEAQRAFFGARKKHFAPLLDAHPEPEDQP